MEKNNTIITGGTGLIGSAFREGLKIGSKDYNLTSQSEVEKLFKDTKPNVVIHTAARVGGVGANMNYPANFYYDNIMMNTNIIHHAYLNNVKKLVCFLSTCVFPDNIDYPLDESKIHKGEPHFTNAAYAYAKRMADVQIQAYNKQYGTQYFSVIPCNVYGINDNFDLQNGHVIPMLIHKCYLSKINNTPFEVWGDGSALREFIFSEDVANIVGLLIDNYKETSPIIISNPKEYSIKQVVDLIVKYMEFEGEVVWLKDKPNGQHRKPSSNKKLLSVIGEYNFTTLEIGLQKTVEWFKLNYHNIRK
jgi:GDP-L-fucose synthase